MEKERKNRIWLKTGCRTVRFTTYQVRAIFFPPHSFSCLEAHVGDSTDLPVAVFFFLLPQARASGGMSKASSHLKSRALTGCSRCKIYPRSMHYPFISSFKAISGCVGTEVHISQTCRYQQLVTPLPRPSTKLLNCSHSTCSLLFIQPLDSTESQNGVHLGINATQELPVICT